MTDRIRRQETLPAAGVAIASEFMDGMGEMPPHGHDYVEIVLVEGGQAVHGTRFGERRVERGYSAVLRPGEWHSWSECLDLQVWNVYIGPEVLHRELGWFRDTTQGSRLVGPPRSGNVTERLLGEEAFRQARRWLVTVPSREIVSGIALDTRRVASLSGALGEIAAAPSFGPTEQPPTATHLDPTVAATLKLLERDVARAWTVAELAERAHLSVSHVSRIFTHATGMAPITYLARLRAERMAADLIDGDASVSEIGGRHGWPDPNYASRRFRHFFGVSPRTFRRQFGRWPVAGGGHPDPGM